MKLSSLLLVLAACTGGEAEDVPGAAEVETTSSNNSLSTLENRGGWVNPEDLLSMPQCIAQQDQTEWLAAMSRCTSKRCTRHFGVICTHHQWLTQLSCLSVEFSPDLVNRYLPYCGRSVLAKAQLFRWIHTVTGRDWLVEAGDANGLLFPSPALLSKGYSEVEVTYNAPTCLTESFSTSSQERFRYIMGSCEFTAHSYHAGNADRPWEYWESLQSMKSLDFETANYDLTGSWIASGLYFDNSCFCDTFNMDAMSEPCSGESLDLTRERMWMYATCGPASLPNNWRDGLKTTEYDFIPSTSWRWPKCHSAMPRKVTSLFHQCATAACDQDSRGYCIVRNAIDRACFCRNVSYESCKGDCHNFENRIDYVKWLHGLCGREHGWQGLPKHWRQLAAPTPLDMIPWGFSLISANHVGRALSHRSDAFTNGFLAVLVLASFATLQAVVFLRKRDSGIAPLASRLWFPAGSVIAVLFLLASLINALIARGALNDKQISFSSLLLLGCSMPRATWPAIVLLGFQKFTESTIPVIGTLLCTELIMQVISAFTFISTVDYGREHSFYDDGMLKIASMPPAQLMYGGALAWLVLAVVMLVLLIQAFCVPTRSRWSTEYKSDDRHSTPVFSALIYEIAGPMNTLWSRLETRAASYFFYRLGDSERSPLLDNEVAPYRNYGAATTKNENEHIVELRSVRLTLVALMGLGLVWTTQVIFWMGFAGLALNLIDNYRLFLLATVWGFSQVVAVAVAIFI